MVNIYWKAASSFDADKPTVFLLHPAWMNSLFFEEAISQLFTLNGTINDVNYITVDLNGHGKTAEKSRPSQITMWEQTDDLIALLDELNISTAIFAGMSLGAMVALHTAIKYPSRIAGLVLMASRATNASEAEKEGFETLIQLWTATPQPTEDVMNAAILGWGGKPDLNNDRSKLIKQRWFVDTAGGRSKVQPVYDFYLSAADLTERLGEITVPVLIMHGTEDLTFPFHEAEIIRDGLVNAEKRQLVPIQGEGHLILGMRRGEDVVAQLENFVAEVTK